MSAGAAVAHLHRVVGEWAPGGVRDGVGMLAVRAPSRAKLSLMDTGAPAVSPFAIDARRGERRGRGR